MKNNRKPNRNEKRFENIRFAEFIRWIKIFERS